MRVMPVRRKRNEGTYCNVRSYVLATGNITTWQKSLSIRLAHG